LYNVYNNGRVETKLRSTCAGHVNMLLRALATSLIDGISPNLYKIFILKIFLLRFKMSDIGFLIIWDENLFCYENCE
jgi:hypothetical protein